MLLSRKGIPLINSDIYFSVTRNIVHVFKLWNFALSVTCVQTKVMMMTNAKRKIKKALLFLTFLILDVDKK